MIKLGGKLIKAGIIISVIGIIIAAAIGFPIILILIIPAVISWFKRHSDIHITMF